MKKSIVALMVALVLSLCIVPMSVFAAEPLLVTTMENSTSVGGVNMTMVSYDLADAQIARIANQTYTGSAIKPMPEVSLYGTLEEGEDYTISYQDNVNVGQATLTVTAEGYYYVGSQSVTFNIVAASISGASVTGVTSKTFTGSALTQTPVVKVGSKTLTLNKDYALSYKNNKNVGTATMTITGTGNYTGTVTKSFTITRAANPIVVKPKVATVKFAKVKKAKQILARKRVLAISKAKGNLTYNKRSGNAKIAVNKKTGKVTVKKGLGKGTYKVKVAIKAAGNSNYKAKAVVKTFKVKVK